MAQRRVSESLITVVGGENQIPDLVIGTTETAELLGMSPANVVKNLERDLEIGVFIVSVLVDDDGVQAQKLLFGPNRYSWRLDYVNRVRREKKQEDVSPATLRRGLREERRYVTVLLSEERNKKRVRAQKILIGQRSQWGFSRSYIEGVKEQRSSDHVRRKADEKRRVSARRRSVA